MAQTWQIGLFANGVIAAAFLAVAVLLATNLTTSRQWKGNILGAGTFALYLACGGGHLVRFLQILYPTLGLAVPAGAAVRYEYTDWHPWVFDLFTMVAGVSYWMMRRRFPDLVSGAAVYEDLRERQRRALEIHDNVVQGLVRAKLSLDMGRHEEGGEAVADTLEASKRIITELLGKEQVALGALRRGGSPPAPSGGEAPGRT